MMAELIILFSYVFPLHVLLFHSLADGARTFMRLAIWLQVLLYRASGIFLIGRTAL